MDKKNMRKELMYGVVLLVIYLVMRIFPRDGFLMGLLLVAGLVLLVIGMLPENLYDQVKKIKDQVLRGKGK